jgi:hypothetical protein
MKIRILESHYNKLFESLNPSIPIKEIMRGYIEAALWTEEERLQEEANGSYDGYDSDEEDGYSDDEDDDDSTRELNKLIKITAEFNRKPFGVFEQNDIDQNSIIRTYEDVKKFLSNIPSEILEQALEEQGAVQFGHDIWFTRNHHGVGFWDGDYSSEVEEILMNAIKVLKEVNLVLGDDMKLYFE